MISFLLNIKYLFFKFPQKNYSNFIKLNLNLSFLKTLLCQKEKLCCLHSMCNEITSVSPPPLKFMFTHMSECDLFGKSLWRCNFLRISRWRHPGFWLVPNTNDWCPYKKRGQRHSKQGAWRWRQRLELRCHKSRTDCLRPPAVGGARRTLP